MSELKKLICIREAVMPGLGHFKPGDVITDPDLIERIGEGHPFFSANAAPEETPTEEGN